METSLPVFEYRLSGKDGELGPEDKLWDTPLYSNENNISIGISPFSIGDYLLSARKFLEGNKYQSIEKGLQATVSNDFEISGVKRIIISLEKHGPFYHPIKIILFFKSEDPVSFVLNGAVSDIGLAVIENEFRNLKELRKKTFSDGNSTFRSFIPEVFGMGFIEATKGKIGFFLAQWLDGFEEFHVVKSDHKNEIGLLNSDGTFSFLSDIQSFEIFKKASEILTFYFDLHSFNQIFPWHHAAGDFIVKIDEAGIDVKLITIRNYGKLIDSDTDNIMLELLFFFLNLSLRMRIDRNRGTEEYIFLDEMVVKASVEGFFKGLNENLKRSQKQGLIDSDFYEVFIEFIKEFNFDTLLNLFGMIEGSYTKDVPETAIIHKNLEAHAKAMFEAIKKF
jgi:hypothetical protein